MASFDLPLASHLRARYVIERELGRGGMATVYLAQDLKHDRPVALKVLIADLAASLGSERFLREIKVTARLDHPHIVPILDSGENGGQLWYTMPYVSGESLRARLQREGALPIDVAVQLGCEVADALQYAHRHGVIHRDIKPENILLSDGHARVADFGVARAIEVGGSGQLTETGMAVGTPVYMSLEQAAAGQVDARSDQYSLACVVYELLAGEPPYTGGTPQAVTAKRFLEPVPHVRTLRETVSESLEAVLTRALAKSPADRYPTAGDFGRALSEALNPLSIGYTPTASVPASSRLRTVRNHLLGNPRIWVLSAAVALLATIVGVSLARRLWRSPEPVNATSGPQTRLLNPARLAVLYFQDFTGSDELGYLADALTEGIIDALAPVKGLEVVSREGAGLYRAKALPRDSIARALQVGTLVDGAVELVGDRIRVTIRLVDGVSGADYERVTLEQPRDAVLAIRDTVTEKTAQLLRTRLGEEIQLRRRLQNTTSTTAWSLLQRAENVRKQADSLLNSDASVANGRYLAADSFAALSERADPDWVEPATFRAHVAFRLSRFTLERDSARPWIQRGLIHAERALTKASDDPASLAVRGTLRYWKWLIKLGGDSAQAARLLGSAQQDLEAAVKLDPSQADAWSTLSHLYYQVPDVQRAKLAAVRAYEEDTYLRGVELVLFRLFTTSFDLDQTQEATRWCQVGVTRFPDHPRFVECQLWLLAESAQGNIELAWRLARRRAQLGPVSTRPLFKRKSELFVAALLAQAGLRDSAMRVLERASASSPSEDPTQELPWYAARVHLLLGNREEAFSNLKRYCEWDPSRLGEWLTNRWFRDLAGDPALSSLISSCKKGAS